LIDSDLEKPEWPSVLPSKWQDDCDVIYGMQVQRKDKFINAGAVSGFIAR